MQSRSAAAVLSTAGLIVLGCCGAAAAAERFRTALVAHAAPTVTVGVVAHQPSRQMLPVATQFTAAILSPSPDHARGPAVLGNRFGGGSRATGFDLDLTRLYRSGARTPRIASDAHGANAVRTLVLATWEMPITITPATRGLAATLQQRADKALAAQVAKSGRAQVR